MNVPIRTVLFTQLCKYDGQNTKILSVRDFHQIAGRAGRKGFDDQGTVVAQAPAHVVENLRNEQKAAGDPKKLKKLVKRKPPEKGYVPWTKETFEKLIKSEPETLQSRFQVTHGMLLQVLSRASGDGCREMATIIRKSHEAESTKKRIGRTAFQFFRSLVERKIIELAPLRVHVDLQEDFSLHHALSLYLVDTVALLDPEHPEFAFDVLTLVESILENPDLILRRQLDRIKTEKMAELKAEGMEFDQRIEELEKLEYPKPRREFIYDTFNAFAAKHPWVGQENIRPKSIAREMFEHFVSFPEYIREYDLHRAEGLLLRYLSETYKTLVQTVPEPLKTDEVLSMEDYFGSMLKSVDSSLIDEWEKLRSGKAFVPSSVAPSELDRPRDLFSDRKRLTVLIRNEVFRFVRALARENYSEALDCMLPNERWTEDSLKAAMEVYYSDHARILTDPNARAPKNLAVEEGRGQWTIRQTLIDPDGHNDWAVSFEMDVERSLAEFRPVLRLIAVEAVS